MTLTQMKYFAEVCREKSVTRAAEKLHISQPSVTVAMQELEAETGLNLFVRQGKRIEVTPEGEFLLAKVSAILHSVEQLNNDIGELVHTKNHIKLALPLQVGSILIPMIFEEFIPATRKSGWKSSSKAAWIPCEWWKSKSLTWRLQFMKPIFAAAYTTPACLTASVAFVPVASIGWQTGGRSR